MKIFRRELAWPDQNEF